MLFLATQVGTVENPTYQQVCTDTTGHFEAVQITYDPEIFPYEKLLELFWQQIDPTDPGGQFHDRGQSYQTAIFYQDDTQKRLAEQSKQALQESGLFSSRSSHQSCLHNPFIRPKTTISTTIRKIGPIMNPIM